MQLTMNKPISILLCALGGEGGGVLADWLVEAARHGGYPAQATSIPGVAQRTGATTYYLEIFPVPLSALEGHQPVFGLNPLPGRLDLMVSSELLESVRQVSLGLTAPECTLLISAGNRVLTTQEKMHLADGRLSDAALIEILQQHTRQCHVLDMAAITRAAGTVVSAVMLGCIAESGVLPLKRADFEAAIGQGSASQKASLRGFVMAYEEMARRRTQADYVQSVLSDALPSAAHQQPAVPEQIARDFPSALHELLTLAHSQLLDYQDRRYAELYLERMRAIVSTEHAASPGSHAVSREVARWLALWMAFDDIVRVAELKSRASRFARIRQEARATPDDLIKIYDHFKPGIPEIAGLLPSRWAKRLLIWDQGRRARGKPQWAMPIKVGTHTVVGMLSLRFLANLKRFRTIGHRYQNEQALIEEWLDMVSRGTAQGVHLGVSLAQCGQLIKGYGSTNDRGRENLLHILRHLGIGGNFPSADARAKAINQARQAALRDEAGTALDSALSAHGVPARPPKAQPVHWMPRRAQKAGANSP